MLRLFATPNIEGPRVRLGIVWFLFALPAVYAGPVPTAALFGLHALIAALQGGQAWRREGYRPSRLLAGPAALALPVLAIDSYTTPAVVLVVLPFLALAVAIATPRRKRRTSALATAGITLRCAVPAGVAAAGMVYTTRLGVAPAMVFFALLTAHDIGSFTYGAEASSPITGIFWGALFTFGAMAPVFCFQLPPFDGTPAAWVFAGLVAILGPLGQIAASASLPTAATWVPALRRLDSYIFAAPFWAFSMWSYLT